jgi:hypothetical protein
LEKNNFEKKMELNTFHWLLKISMTLSQESGSKFNACQYFALIDSIAEKLLTKACRTT